MSDVKPDTSLYSALEMKLHALAKALNCPPDGLLEELDAYGGAWRPATGTATDFMVRLAKGCEYRLKSKPRELWAVYAASGDRLGTYSAESYANKTARTPGRTVVRFVESPPAA